MMVSVIYLSLHAFSAPLIDQENFKKGPTPSAKSVSVPYILWGGDVATFTANGGLKTKAGSPFHKLGLDINLTDGNDFKQQIRDYLAGKTPFLRCTMRMAGIASEVINRQAETRGSVVMQLTWSAGDHMVSRASVKKANDLKGKTVVLQEMGPHVGMLDDILKSANLNWSDIKVIWTKDITGPSGPAEKFRKDSSIDACFVITPDMIGLTGGHESIGTGAEGTVKNAKICISTAELSRSIADVYICRNDFLRNNKGWVEKFCLGMFQAMETIKQEQKKYEQSGSKTYMDILKMTQSIFGPEAVPTLEEDAHGLLLDCQYVGQPGNLSFFSDKKNLQGFANFNKSSLAFAQSNQYINNKIDFLPSGVDFLKGLYKSLPNYVDLSSLGQALKSQKRFNAEALREEVEAFASGEGLDDKTLVSFTINFSPDQVDFDIEQYRSDFNRAMELSSKYGNAALIIEGHSDPTKCLATMVRAGLKTGVLKRVGSSGQYQYYLKGKKLDFQQTRSLLQHIEAGSFDGSNEYRPREIMTAAKNLSLKRAKAVKDSVLQFAKKMGIHFDETQIQPTGSGISNPVIPKPGNAGEAAVNRRVEFRLVKVSAETLNESDFDF
jgi:outer membrane protein OmpA-like peptidoglycan-associated protein